MAFSKAHEYITRYLNRRSKIPLAKWKHKLAELTAQRGVMLGESDDLSAELRSAETIKRNAEKMMNAPKPHRTQDMEL